MAEATAKQIEFINKLLGKLDKELFNIQYAETQEAWDHMEMQSSGIASTVTWALVDLGKWGDKPVPKRVLARYTEEELAEYREILGLEPRSAEREAAQKALTAARVAKAWAHVQWVRQTVHGLLDGTVEAESLTTEQASRIIDAIK